MTDKQFITEITTGVKKVKRTVRRARAKVDKHIKNAQKVLDAVFPPPTKRRP